MKADDRIMQWKLRFMSDYLVYIACNKFNWLYISKRQARNLLYIMYGVMALAFLYHGMNIANMGYCQNPNEISCIFRYTNDRRKSLVLVNYWEVVLEQV